MSEYYARLAEIDRQRAAVTQTPVMAGEPCPTCKRRIPLPREDKTPRKKTQFNVTVPKDAEDGEEILRHLIEEARKKIGRPEGTPPYFTLVEALHDYLTA